MAVIFFLQDFISIHIIVKDFCFNESDFFFCKLFVHVRTKLFCFNKSDFFFCIIAKCFCFMKSDFFFCKIVYQFITYQSLFVAMTMLFFSASLYIYSLHTKHCFTYVSDFFSANLTHYSRTFFVSMTIILFSERLYIN